MSFEFNTISIFNKVSAVTVVVVIPVLYRRVVEGGRYPCAPQTCTPLELQAGFNTLNSKLAYIFRFFLFYQSTLLQFVHFMIISQIPSCTLILFTIFFCRVSFKMIGNYGQMTNSQPSCRQINIDFKLYFFLIPVF